MLRPAFAVEPLEDFNKSVALNEFTLYDFRMDLSRYIETNRKKLLDAPHRFYAVVPKNAEHTVIKPVAIYCLKQRADARENEAVKALQPYFLVYIRDDGEVRCNFTAPKQILQIFGTVCPGKTEAYAALCKLFDEESKHGEDMSRCRELLDRAVAAIAGQFARKNAAHLFAGRSGKLARLLDFNGKATAAPVNFDPETRTLIRSTAKVQSSTAPKTLTQITWLVIK